MLAASAQQQEPAARLPVFRVQEPQPADQPGCGAMPVRSVTAKGFDAQAASIRRMEFWRIKIKRLGQVPASMNTWECVLTARRAGRSDRAAFLALPPNYHSAAAGPSRLQAPAGTPQVNWPLRGEI